VTPTGPRPSTVALVALGIHVLLVVLVVVARDDPAFFVHFGSADPAADLAVDALGPDVPFAGPNGHDGQAFWAVARDPLLLGDPPPASELDRPRYRAQRVAYPLLAAPGRLLGEGGLLWALVVVNLAVVAIGTLLSSRLSVLLGAPPWVGLAFGLNPLVLFATTLDLSDALALASLVGVALAIRRRRPGVGVAWGVLAALSREASILAAIAMAVLGRQLSTRARVAIAAGPIAAAGMWGLYVRARLPPDRAGFAEVVVVPFKGFVDAVNDFWRPRGGWEDAVVAALVVGVAVWVILRWARRRTLEMYAALPSALLVPFLGAPVVFVSFGIMKAIGPALTFAALDVYAERAHQQIENVT
jgi:hypothetical protein